jgi:hypothetical protein
VVTLMKLVRSSIGLARVFAELVAVVIELTHVF